MREFIFSPVFQLPGCRGREKWMEDGRMGGWGEVSEIGDWMFTGRDPCDSAQVRPRGVFEDDT